MIEFEKILCATDFSKMSFRAAEYARILATRFGAELILLHVVELVPPIATPRSGAQVATLNLVEYRKFMHENAVERLGQLAEQFETPDLKIRQQIVEGKPGDEIVTMAHDDAVDLIVIATHGHSGWRRFLFGSVADKVVRSATCPVLTVGPEEQD